MYRTTIMLPFYLKTKATTFANKEGISLGELIRDSLQEKLDENTSKDLDPFFMDNHYFSGKIPMDLSDNHDKYLLDS